MKKVSTKERLEIYENFFSHLHFLRHVSGNERKILEMLSVSDTVAVAKSTHDAAGKPLTEDQITSNINAALLLMKEASK